MGINKIVDKLKNSELVSTSFFSAIGTGIGIFSGFVVNKVVAIIIGPSGIALVSQFQNFINISTIIGSGGIQQGVVKYLAEVRGDSEKKSKLLSTSFQLSFFLSIVAGLIIILNSNVIVIKLFDYSEYRHIIIIFGLVLILFSLNNLIINVLNGIGEIKKLTLVNISSNLFSLFITASCAYFFEVEGALLSLATSQSVIFLVSLTILYKSSWFRKSDFLQKFDYEYAIKLLKFSLMGVFSLILPPLLQIGIRNYIIESESIEIAGMWDGICKISTAYLGLMTTTLSIYFLPKFSILNDRIEIRNELIKGYKLIFPILCFSIFFLYLFRENVIIILYSKLFLRVEDLFLPQLIGDFFKISSWLLAFLMIAKAKTKLFILSQIFFSSSLYILTIYFFDRLGIIGVTWAYAINSAVYLLFNIFIFRKYLFI